MVCCLAITSSECRKCLQELRHRVKRFLSCKAENPHFATTIVPSNLLRDYLVSGLFSLFCFFYVTN